jgi:hypothetical protein
MDQNANAGACSVAANVRQVMFDAAPNGYDPVPGIISRVIPGRFCVSTDRVAGVIEATVEEGIESEVMYLKTIITEILFILILTIMFITGRHGRVTASGFTTIGGHIVRIAIAIPGTIANMSL